MVGTQTTVVVGTVVVIEVIVVIKVLHYYLYTYCCIIIYILHSFILTVLNSGRNSTYPISNLGYIE